MNVNHNKFSFKKNELYYGKNKTGTELVADPRFPTMFWVSTPTGSSEDFYNRARAKSHAITLTTEDLRQKGFLSPSEGGYVSFTPHLGTQVPNS